MKLVILFISGAFLVIFSSHAFAQSIGSYAYLCNNCTPSQTLEDAQYGAAGNYYIYDFVQGQLTQYRVTGSDTNIITRPSQVVSRDVPKKRKVVIVANSAETMAVFNAAKLLYDENGGTDVYGVESVSINSAQAVISPALAKRAQPFADQNGHANAFDVVSTPAIRQMVINQLVATHYWSAKVRPGIAALLNVLPNSIGMKSPISVYIQGNFPDLSSSIIKYDESEGVWKYVPGSSKDSVGNPIPETSVAAAGGMNSHQNYLFPGGDKGQQAGHQQLQNLSDLGILAPVELYGGTWEIGCVNVAGSTTTCTSFYFGGH